MIHRYGAVHATTMPYYGRVPVCTYVVIPILCKLTIIIIILCGYLSLYTISNVCE